MDEKILLTSVISSGQPPNNKEPNLPADDHSGTGSEDEIRLINLERALAKLLSNQGSSLESMFARLKARVDAALVVEEETPQDKEETIVPNDEVGLHSNNSCPETPSDSSHNDTHSQEDWEDWISTLQDSFS